MTNMNQLFISHEKSDTTVALIMKEFLEACHPSIKVFVAGRDLSGGEVWAEEIRLKLEEAKVIISLITPYSTTSSWVLFETGAGFIDRKSIPLIGDGLGISAIPSPYQVLQARLINHQGMLSLLNDIVNHLGIQFDIDEVEILKLVGDIDNFFVNRRESVPVSSDEESPEVDEELARRMLDLASRAKAAMLARFESSRDKTALPPSEELEEMGLIRLVILASDMGLDWPFLTSLHLYQLVEEPPLASDPAWKKENISRKLDEIESELTEFE